MRNLKVRKAKLKGASGVTHNVDTVELEGKRYILIRASDDIADYMFEYFIKLLICYDVHLPPLIIARPATVPENVRRIVKELNGVILEIPHVNLNVF